MICERCGTVFCWDGADQLFIGGTRKRFCSDLCRVKAQQSTQAARRRRALRLRQAATCSSRGKEPYGDIHAALIAAARIFRKTGKDLYPYECACGSWHLSKKQMANDHLLRESS
jgi:hypothetical protein